MSYEKTITPSYTTIGRRQKLTGFIGELHDGNILLHSQEYPTNGAAEWALDKLVYELLSDQAEHGLVDDVPAALEAEGVTSTQIPSWLLEAQAKVDACTQDNPCDNVNHNHTGYRMLRCGLPNPLARVQAHEPPPGFPDDDDGTDDGGGPPRCHNCSQPHHTWQCPEIHALLFAEPVVMVVDVEYAPFGFAA